MNVFCFTGNLGKDAEQRYLPDGTSIVLMSVPCKSGYGDKAVTSWLRCSMFGKRGESVLPYLKKGQSVGVTGEFAAREYTDKEGQQRLSLEVRVNDLTLLGSKDKGGSQETQHRQAPNPKPQREFPDEFDDLDSEIPF